MHEVDDMGIQAVVEAALNYLSPNREYPIHLRYLFVCNIFVMSVVVALRSVYIHTYIYIYIAGFSVSYLFRT